MNPDTVTSQVRSWLEQVVIDLNLCPFAQRELLQNRVRFAVCESDQPVMLLQRLQQELEYLQSDPAAETTLLIHPAVLQDFQAYNQFLDVVDALLEDLGLQGEFQVASFHPDYQFAATDYDDAENFTNRAPYPILHILRETSVALAIDTHPDAGNIPDRNIQLMRHMGAQKMRELLATCV